MIRRKTLRDIGTIVLIAAILGGIVLVNYLTRQQNLKERMIGWRKQIEEQRESKGLQLLPWELLEQTSGNVRRGPTFPEDLLALDRAPIDLIGFMVPVDKFHEMEQFLILPMPIQCYFCQAPPMRDIVLVQMKEGEKADLYNEPILINGTLNLNRGPGTKFFYVVKDASFGPGEERGKLTVKHMSELHAGHYRAAKLAEELAKQKKFEGRDTSFLKEEEAEKIREAEKNLVAGRLFLEKSLEQESVEELPHTGGVQYKVLETGEGRTPKVHDRVKVHYCGWLMGKDEPFDNSYEREEPAVLGVNKVIPGWTDALLHMKEGDKWLLFIPPERGYGEAGMGKTIPPNMVLIFELELIEVLD